MVDNVHPLTRYRQSEKLTITALAERLGVSKAAVSRWEAGRLPDRSMWPIIRERTGIRPEELVGHAGEAA